MRNLKKFLALVLAMMMTLSLMVTVNASSFTDKDFTDDYTEAVDVLAALGVINGYGDGTFLPKEKIDRCEVAAILYRIVTGDVDSDNIHLYDGYSEFTDVTKDAWYTPYVNFCANNGLINGVGGNRFAPKAKITGYEALVMILRAIGYNNPTEFSSSDWKFKASGYGSRLGITTNIPAGSLGAEATREMVAEIMFQGLLVPTVSYSPLTLYTENILTKASKDDHDRPIYAADVPSTLMYETFKIVGKRTVITNDKYGRPSTEWVVDNENDTILNGGKYVVNIEGNAAPLKDNPLYTTPGATYDDPNEDNDMTDRLKDEKKIAIAETPVKTYTDVITECKLAQDINSDKGFTAARYLNGKKIDDKKIDELHTVNTNINSQGRTMEAYKYLDPVTKTTKFTLVFIDTVMGTVVDVTPVSLDTAGHPMEKAKLTVAMGLDASASKAPLVSTIIFEQSKNWDYKIGDVVLLQTSNGGMYEFKGDYIDVPTYDADWNGKTGTGNWVRQETKPDKLSTDPTIVRSVTVKGTKGDINFKTGIETTDGKEYKLSNTYMGGIDAVRAGSDSAVQYANGTNDGTTLAAYLVPVTNNLINRTFDLYLDHNGYVVGMKEVGSAGVGVILNSDYSRVGAGKYVVDVELIDFDGNKKELQFINEDVDNDGSNKIDYFTEAKANEAVTKDDTDYLDDLRPELLISYSSITMDGKQYCKLEEKGSLATDNTQTRNDTNADNSYVNYNGGAAGTAGDFALTGVTDTLSSTVLVDDNTRFLVASYAPDYSVAPGANDGGMKLDGFKPFTGFKTIPTLSKVTGQKVTWTHLDVNGVRYVALMSDNSTKGLVWNGQKTMTPDESYLILGTGTTYQFYSTYKALKNGELVDVNVSSLNTDVNKKIEAVMASDKANVKLITFTGKDAAGNYNAMANSTDNQFISTNPAAHTIAAATSVVYKAGVLTVNGSTYLTMADNAKIVIVNSADTTVHPGTLDSIRQYNQNIEEANDNVFMYELDTNGYVSCLYIID